MSFLNGGSTSSGSQQYSYDRWGNRNITPSSPALGFNTSFEKEDATNRLYAPGDLVLADSSRRIRYDAAGNQIKDTFTGYGTANFDAENHITAIQDKLGGWSNYTYNADGQRTRRKINNQETWHIYGMDGELLAEYAANGAPANPQKEYGYRNGQLLVTTALDTVWSDDAVPAGAAIAGDNESWNWVSSNPGSFSGNAAHQSNIVAGLHQHYFYGATATLSVGAGDKLVAYVYLDPSNLPSEIMLQWNDGTWEHRAYWGANNLPWGVDGTNSRRNMGPLPAAGSWVRLEVPASLVGLEGHTLHGMAFSMWGGRATWDRAGKTSAGVGSSIQWLVSDHLGTPRMAIDQTGTLANVKRHDYLPFGEELFAGTGGRTVAQGYSAADGVRQQFTSKERDVETGLDYFLARYYSSTQGRFIGTDPYDINIERQNARDPAEGDALFSDYLFQPQHWNRYAYALNNPLRYVDPDGLEEYNAVLLGKRIKVKISNDIDKEERDAIKENIAKAIAKINAGAGKLTSEQIKAINSMNGIEVRNDVKFPFMNPESKVFNMTQSRAENPNLDNLIGDIIHDSFHADQMNRGLSFKTPEDQRTREQEASAFTIEVGEKIGINIDAFKDDARTGHTTPRSSPYTKPPKKKKP